ncbi:adenosylmethionine--8-amino-7-oxononanoate transaminase [Cytophagaceae bacterium ABcell3]|nr:adenosylmethionine--8-amino-7-oxononanoate transaminase [Cytophagaceae bacterium ABcell3]
MSKELQHIDTEHIWHPFTPLLEDKPPFLVKSAEGVYLYTADGKKILDAVSSWWVNIHGHANKKIAEAIYKQAMELEQVIFAGFTHEPAIKLAKSLIEILPGQQRRIFYSDNGSTAVEAALKMAMQYWYNQKKEKRTIVALEGAYHGDTFGAMSTGSRSTFTRPFDHWLFNVEFVSLENPIESFEKIAQGKDVAAFLYEPLVQGTAGMKIYPKELLEQLIQIAKSNDIICIADEVMTGFGRTGKLFASEYCATPPDIICMSKGITGGFIPLGATACNAKIEQAFLSSSRENMFFHGHSYTGNPLACAAANASMEILKAPETLSQINMISEMHKAFMKSLEHHPKIAHIKSLGTILSIEIKTNNEPGYFNNIRDYMYDFFINNDILLRPLGNTIYLLPPYVIEAHEIKYIYSKISELLEQL